jgi:hypothetical protein
MMPKDASPRIRSLALLAVAGIALTGLALVRMATGHLTGGDIVAVLVPVTALGSIWLSPAWSTNVRK